ncbi:hypothetical protein [Methylobrevis pamukkalensis]|uniref:hypothetical protein n=1 Tax=Methylobrevis pamukkalensis TaxID=1439726 RepID=UPI00114C9F6B|nr:hypothetical protein [Methylobrevis pamukkalensis]
MIAAVEDVALVARRFGQPLPAPPDPAAAWHAPSRCHPAAADPAGARRPIGRHTPSMRLGIGASTCGLADVIRMSIFEDFGLEKGRRKLENQSEELKSKYIHQWGKLHRIGPFGAILDPESSV